MASTLTQIFKFFIFGDFQPQIITKLGKFNGQVGLSKIMILHILIWLGKEHLETHQILKARQA